MPSPSRLLCAAIFAVSLSSCGPGLCLEGECTGLTLSADVLAFGTRSFGSLTTQIVLITNSGGSDIESITVTTPPVTPFSFAGGTYPGTDGTCGTTLALGASCSLVFAFEPPTPVMDHSATVVLSFSRGGSTKEVAIALEGRADSGAFNNATGLNGGVSALTQSGGLLWAVGGFLSHGSNPANGLAALNPSTGAPNLSFPATTALANAGFSFAMTSVVPAADASGDLYVGGAFSTFNGTANINNIVRINSDGSRDTGFDLGAGATAGLNSYPYEIAPAIDGSRDVYVVGLFSQYRGVAAMGIVRIDEDGTRDAGFSVGTGFQLSGFQGLVMAVATATDGSGDIYAGGAFDSYRGTADIRGLVRINNDGSVDTGFDIGTGASAGTGAVMDIALAQDGSNDVYMGGAFTTYRGTANVNGIARINSDGTLDTGFYIGSGASAGFNGTVTLVRPATDGSGDVYVGGDFTSYRGTSNTNRFVRLNSDGSIDSAFNIGSGSTAGFNNSPATVLFANDGSGDLYVGGGFTSYKGSPVSFLIRMKSDGSRVDSFATGSGTTSGLMGWVYAIGISSDTTGDAYFGGQFLAYNSTPYVNRLLRLNSDSTVDTGFSLGSSSPGGPDATVAALLPVADGDIYVAGGFSSFGGVTANRMVRLNRNGSRDETFDIGSGFDQSVTALALAADGTGDIYVGGVFTTYKGVSNINRIVRLNQDGSRDTAFNIGSGATAGFDSAVSAIAVARDGSGDIYVAGPFASYNGAANIRRIVRLNNDGSRDTAFDIGSGASAGFNNTVNAVVAATDGSGDIYVGGSMATYNGTANIRSLIRLNSDGTIDSAFNIGSGASAGFTGNVYSLALATDSSGDVYVGGMFTAYNGISGLGNMIRLNNDGTIDSAFSTGTLGFTGTNGTGDVMTIAPTVDGTGDVYAGGTFSTYRGTATGNAVRLSQTGEID